MTELAGVRVGERMLSEGQAFKWGTEDRAQVCEKPAGRACAKTLKQEETLWVCRRESRPIKMNYPDPNVNSDKVEKL